LILNSIPRLNAIGLSNFGTILSENEIILLSTIRKPGFE